MGTTEKPVGHELICGYPTAGGGRCTEKISLGKSCRVHGVRTFEQHPIPSQKCVCERPLIDVPTDELEAPTCFRCGHDLPDRRADHLAGRLVSDGGGGVRRRPVQQQEGRAAPSTTRDRSLPSSSTSAPAPVQLALW